MIFAKRLRAVALVLLLAGCQSREMAPSEKLSPAEELPEMQAEVLEIRPRRWPTIVRCQGSLAADEQAVVGAKVAGRIAEIHFDLGDYVELGSPLVTLDQEEFLLRVAQAESQLLQARSAVGLEPEESAEGLDPLNAPPVRQERALWEEAKLRLTRLMELRKENAVSSSELEQTAADERVAEARYSAAINGVREKIALISIRQADLGLAKQQLKDAVIRAPIAGFVRGRQVALGTYLSVGQSVGVIVRTSPLRFRGTIPERYAVQLSVSQELTLTIESLEEKRQTKVLRVSPSLEPVSRALAFEAEVANDDLRLRAGLFAEGQVVVDAAAEAIVVPVTAIREFAGAQKIWKVIDGIAREEAVLVGERRGEEVEILAGLVPGEIVLRAASQGKRARITTGNR